MAITLADSAGGFGNVGDPPPSQALTNAGMAIGDVLTCLVYLNQTGSPGTQTVSDNVNSGNYTLLNTQSDAGSSSRLYLYSKVANATSGSAPIISVSQSNAQFGHLCVARFTGFVGTPTVDASLATNKFNSVSTTAVSCTPITTDFNTELLICGAFYGSSIFPSVPTGWTTITSDGATFYAVVPTSGTNQSFVGTLNTAIAWQTIFAGIYDNTVVIAPAIGAISKPGPGVSPSSRNQFHVNVRDTSAGLGIMAGVFTPTSQFLGNLTAKGGMTGLFTSTSDVFGQMTGTGNLSGISTSVSDFFGATSQAQTLIGSIPTGGPGTSPSSRFQFSSLALDETNFGPSLINGRWTSSTDLFGQLTASAALSGQFASVSTFRGNLLGVGGVGVLNGLFTASSQFFGKAVVGGPGALTGVFTSSSDFLGNLVGIVTPVTPGVCTNLWSADGNFNWSADGYPGISADGYEPTPLTCAQTYFSSVGVNVGTLTFQYSPFGVPQGWVITGYVPFINTSFAGQFIPLIISLGPAPAQEIITVPNVIGMYYFDAQQALLHAGFFIDEPIWAFSTSSSGTGKSVTIDSTLVTIDSTVVTIDGFGGSPPITSVLPQYVFNQSIPAGTTFTQQTLVKITVQGFPVVNQPGITVPVP
jgi:hypothetical protein